MIELAGVIDLLEQRTPVCLSDRLVLCLAEILQEYIFVVIIPTESAYFSHCCTIINVQSSCSDLR